MLSEILKLSTRKNLFGKPLRSKQTPADILRKNSLAIALILAAMIADDRTLPHDRINAINSLITLGRASDEQPN